MFKPRTILLVDDNTMSLDLLTHILNSQGHRILVAENGRSALMRSQLANPDVIFLNSVLSDMSGFDCCQRIRENETFAQTPILMISDGDEDAFRVECFKSGASGYAMKPIFEDEICSILNTQLELLQLREEMDTVGQAKNYSIGEFDAIIDFIAHDMKSPIVCISGFTEELAEQFSEVEVSEEWHEYLSYIHKSANDIDTILEALVILKNLRVREWHEPETIRLATILEGVVSRYEQLEYTQVLELQSQFDDSIVITQPALLEELILILFRNFSNLVGPESALQLHIEIERSNAERLLLRLNGNTRPMEAVELAHILEPMEGTKRKRVQDVNILMLCVQKMIAYLGINGWAEHGPDQTLTICLALESKTE
ncbi:response regulator [Coraliomargarita sp. SDUM461004]|uniref:histidine kinase n=1 Tax=Thalassobacterium sedimentorum TaxID=3041258 RepID=A0ABU1AGV1_9BACT|nr:response regulator [Coraliomargarita sp. SDUM461004]MDQ8193819.1 response regulator [Coraliomargarita sp. SDUM461004]